MSDANPNPVPAIPSPVKNPRRRFSWKLIAGAALLVVILFVAIPKILHVLRTASTDDAYVNSDDTFVAPRVAGQVARVLVEDNNLSREVAPSSDRLILITGATGATGSAAIETLSKRRRRVRAMVHKIDARSEKLQALGAEIVQGDLTDFDAVNAALEGVAAAYYVYPIQVPGILEATAFFAEAALERGVSTIVNMSQITARHVAKSHASRAHWIAERLLDRSGVAVTHLRPTLFAEWLMYFSRPIRQNNMFPLPFGDGRYAPIAAEDQGRIIAEILDAPAEHTGKTYPLFGPRELSLYDIADLLTRVLGRKITYAAMEIEPFTLPRRLWN